MGMLNSLGSEELKLILFIFPFDILQIENPRYLREKPVPLNPVSCQGAPFCLF